VIQLSRLLKWTAGGQSGGKKKVLSPTSFLLSEGMINSRGDWESWLLLGEET